MTKTSNALPPTSALREPVTKVAHLDEHRHRKHRKDAERLVNALSSAIWTHIWEMAERASTKTRRQHLELVIDSDAAGEPRQGQVQHLGRSDT